MRGSMRPAAPSAPDPPPGDTSWRETAAQGGDSCDDELTSALSSVRRACSYARARRFRHPPPPGTVTEDLDESTDTGILPASASDSIETTRGGAAREQDPYLPPPPRPRRSAPWTSLEDVEAALWAHRDVLDALQRLGPSPLPGDGSSDVGMPAAGLSSIRSPASADSPDQHRGGGERRRDGGVREEGAALRAVRSSRSRLPPSATSAPQPLSTAQKREEQEQASSAAAAPAGVKEAATARPPTPQSAPKEAAPSQSEAKAAADREEAPAQAGGASQGGTSAELNTAQQATATTRAHSAPAHVAAKEEEEVPAGEELARVYEAYAAWWEQRARGLRPTADRCLQRTRAARAQDLTHAHTRLHTLQREAEAVRRAQRDPGAAPDPGVAWVRQWGANVPARTMSALPHPSVAADAAIGCSHGFGVKGTDEQWRATRTARAEEEERARARVYYALQCAGDAAADTVGDSFAAPVGDVRQLGPEEETASVAGLSHTAHRGLREDEEPGRAAEMLLPGEDFLGRRARAPFVDVVRGGRTFHPLSDHPRTGAAASDAGWDGESLTSTQAAFEAEEGEGEVATGSRNVPPPEGAEDRGPHRSPRPSPSGQDTTAEPQSAPAPAQAPPPPEHSAPQEPSSQHGGTAPPRRAPAASPIATPSLSPSPALWTAAAEHALHRGDYAYDPLWHAHWDAYLGRGAVYGPGEEPTGPVDPPPTSVLPRRVPPPYEGEQEGAVPAPPPADTSGLVARAHLPRGGAPDPDGVPPGADPVAHEFRRLSAARRQRRHLPPSARLQQSAKAGHGRGPMSPTHRRLLEAERLHAARRRRLLARRGLREEPGPDSTVRVVSSRALASSPASKGLARAHRAVGRASTEGQGGPPHKLPAPAFHCQMCAALLQQGKGTRNCVRCAEERYLWEELRLQRRTPTE